MNEATVYDQYADKYDQWFEKHPNYYQSELLAMEKAVPVSGEGIEIGVGSGRFAAPLNIKNGVEPSENMSVIAKKRGVRVFNGVAEDLPLKNDSYDFATIVTTVCFLDNIPKAFAEVHRILKPKGKFIIGLIDSNSELGKKYAQQKAHNKFYKDAHFHSTEEITELLSQAGFKDFSFWQTLTKPNETLIEEPKPGYGEGSFVVIASVKT